MGTSLTCIDFGDNICGNEYCIPFKFGPERPGKGARPAELGIAAGGLRANWLSYASAA